MARKLKGEVGAPAVASETTQPVASDGSVLTSAAVPDDGMHVGDKGVVAGGVKFLPYTGRESLPDPVRDGKGKIVKPGAPRYFVNNTSGGGELIAIYRKRCGVGRSLVRMIKDHIKDTKENNNAGSKARAFRAMLRKIGIPGA